MAPPVIVSSIYNASVVLAVAGVIVPVWIVARVIRR